MEQIRSYLLSVITAALICCIISGIPWKNSTFHTLRKTLCGIFMSLTLISPLASIRLPDMGNYLDTFRADAGDAVLAGEAMSKETAAEIIKDQTAAYILDKAKELGIVLEVSVTLSDQSPQIPCAVTVSGMVSPYARQRLAEIIEQDLRIDREDQHWINTN